jgi:hypothetical protein
VAAVLRRKYREAEPYFIKALPISETTNGASHHQTVRVLSGIALLYSNCDDLGKDPEPYFRKVIDATKAERDLRETYLTNLCRLASYFAEHKRLEEADELFLQLVKLVGGVAGLSDSDNNWIIGSCIKHFQSRDKSELVAQLQIEKQDHNVYGDMVQTLGTRRSDFTAERSRVCRGTSSGGKQRDLRGQVSRSGVVAGTCS